MFCSCSIISTSLYNGDFRLWLAMYFSLNILHEIQRNFPNCLIHFLWFHKTFFRNKFILILIRSLIRTHRETDSLKNISTQEQYKTLLLSFSFFF